jgi:simple sugar transport system ATP-binding protein
MLAAIKFHEADTMVRQKLLEIGIEVRNTSDLVGTLSGGERQTLAIARAEHIGARLLILDEPTSALGVKEAAIVLRHVLRARANGLAIVFITHNVHHAHAVGDRFQFLDRGHVLGVHDRESLTVEEMTRLMGGGAELQELADELEHLRRPGALGGIGGERGNGEDAKAVGAAPCTDR